MIEDAKRFADLKPMILRYGGRRLVKSYALLDADRDPMRDLEMNIQLMKVSLGDMRFVARYSADRELLDLLFVPEYPGRQYGELRNVVTYYGILLNHPADEAKIEIRDWESKYVDLKWDEAMSILSRVDRRGLREEQIKTTDLLGKLDEAWKKQRPNQSVEVMREMVGLPTGARVSMAPLVLGFV